MNGYGTTEPNQTLVQSAANNNVAGLKTLNNLPVTTPEGKGAIGYAESPDATTAKYSFGVSLKLTQNITLYVIWKDLISVTFDLNGAQGASITKYASNSDYVTTPEAPTRDGYEFLGWALDKNATTGNKANQSIFVGGTSSTSVTYYAIWTNKAILSFDLNNPSASGIINPISADSDGNVKIPSFSNNLTYYKFLGWAFDKDATVATYNPNQTIQITSSKTLYAIWQQTATIVFSPNGGEGTIRTFNLKSLNEQIDFRLGFGYVKPNYELIGWATSATSTQTVMPANADTVTITEDKLGKTTTYYAVWQGKNVNLGFINNSDIEDTLDSLEPAVRYGQKIVIPDESYFDLHDGDYEFLGWTTSEYSFGDAIPEIAFEGGETVNVDALAPYDNASVIKLYAVIVESGYTYTKTVVEPTFEKDGYIDFVCNENPEKSYRQTISKNTLFYSYVEEAFFVSERNITAITTTIQQGSVNVGDTISVVLNDGTVSDVIVEGIEMYHKPLTTAKAGDSVGLIVDIDKDSVSKGSLICAKGKVIHTDAIYVKAHVLSKDEGGRQNPFTYNYRPQILIGGQQNTCVITEIYNLYDNEATNLAYPGKDYVLKIEVPQGATYSFYTWIGQQHKILENNKTVITFEVVARTQAQYNEFLEFCDVKINLQDGSDLKYYHVPRTTLVSELPKPTREGYTFIGWADQDELYDDIDLYDLIGGDTVAYYSTLRTYSKLYAHWIKNDFIVKSSEKVTNKGVTITADVLNADIKLTDTVLVWTGDGFVNSVVTGIFIGEKQYNDLTKGTENVTLLLRAVDDPLPEGSVLEIL